MEFISIETIKASSPNEPPTNTRITRSSRIPSSVKLSKNIIQNNPLKSKPKPKSNTKARYNCPLCKISISTKKEYDLHRASHKNDDKHVCDLCQQSFDNVDKLFTHIRKHDAKNEETEKYQCNICQASFIDINGLDVHIRSHFDLDIRYKCNVCENSFFDIEHLVRHTNEVHKNILNITFTCCICGDLFSSSDDYNAHDRNHKKDAGLLNCSECGEVFPSEGSLNTHKRTHTLSRTQPYACQKCNLKFSRSEDLHIHIRVHDGKAIYSCGLCDRMFAHSKNLTNHIRKCHSSCFAGDEMDLIDFVVEAEVTAQLDRKKLKKVPENDEVTIDGDVFNLNVKELVTKYMKKDSEPRPVMSYMPSFPLPKNVTRKLTEFFRKYKCPLCELIFVKAKTLEIHCKRNHFGNYSVAQLKEILQTIEKSTSQSFSRAILNTRVNVVQQHECPNCNLIYKSRLELIDHLKKHHNGDRPYKCIECSQTFTTSNDLVDHISFHPDKRHECKFCGLTFMNLYSLGKHSKRHEGPNTDSCSICNIPYREKKDLDKHMRVHAGGKPHKCLYCEKRFAQSCDRQKHMRIHTGEKPYVCKVCGKAFAHLTSIKKHNYVHTGERAFQCTVCGKSFQHSSNLIVHNRTHTGERPYKCNICEKTFYASGHYVDHMKIHTGIKNYECQVCKKSFIHLSSFQKHKRVHSGEKPYLCQLCNRAFSQSGHFREHMMIHSGEKPHKCDLCQKSFRRSDALQCHQKTHKKELEKKLVGSIEKVSPNVMMTSYPPHDIACLSNDNGIQYNENEKDIPGKILIHDQSIINQSELINNVRQNDMVNMETSTITVLQPQQTDLEPLRSDNYESILGRLVSTFNHYRTCTQQEDFHFK